MVKLISSKNYVKIICCFLIIVMHTAVLISCEPAPEPDPLPTGVYGTIEDPIYIVMLEGHDVYELFDIEKTTLVNLYCDDPEDSYRIGAVVHYAITTDGALVGWDEKRFYYSRTYSDFQTGNGVAQYLYYKSNIQAMSLDEASNYITFKK